jgi:hypothetical protein
LIIVLALVLAAPASTAAKPKKVASEVDIDGWDSQPPDFEFTFVGNVYSKQPKCVRNREVTVFVASNPDPVGTATTDHTGEWRSAPDTLVAGGTYEAHVAKKKVRKRGKKLVCTADTSPGLFLAP